MLLILFPVLFSAQEENKTIIMKFSKACIYTPIRALDNDEETLGKIESLINTVMVFNYGDNFDAKLYFPDGASNYFTRISINESGKLNNGITYQRFKSLDDTGSETSITLYDNGVVEIFSTDTYSKMIYYP